MPRRRGRSFVRRKEIITVEGHAGSRAGGVARGPARAPSRLAAAVERGRSGDAALSIAATEGPPTEWPWAIFLLFAVEPIAPVVRLLTVNVNLPRSPAVPGAVAREISLRRTHKTPSGQRIPVSRVGAAVGAASRFRPAGDRQSIRRAQGAIRAIDRSSTKWLPRTLWQAPRGFHWGGSGNAARLADRL